MADPHVGSFEVAAIALQFVAEMVLLYAITARWPLMLAPFAARLGPLLWARVLPPLGEGLGAMVAGAVHVRDLAIGAVMLAAAAVAAPVLFAAVPLIAGWAYWLHRRLGGVNGDAHGADVELVEVGLLLVLAAVGQR